MKNELDKAQLKHKLSSYIRRYRRCIPQFGKPEAIALDLVQNTSISELEKIINDIEVIRDRGGEAGSYLKLIINGCPYLVNSPVYYNSNVYFLDGSASYGGSL